jgi:dipeptidyl aminopeptidase/acylaminoacyl peptidase
MRRFRITTRRHAAVAAALVLAAPSARAQAPSNLWSVALRWDGDRLVAGAPVRLTAHEGTGYSGQPSFAPDGRSIVYSSARDTGATARTDIYRMDLRTRAETRVTRTPENENSPTVNARGEYVAVRWQPATLFREFGPWVYGPDGVPARGVLPGPDTTGYYTPLPDGDYALVRPKRRSFTLALFDARAGRITDVDSGVPALPAQPIPGERALSYVRVDSAGGRHELRRYDLVTGRVTALAPTLPGRTAHAWAGRGTVLMGKGNVLYARRIGRDTAWRVLATFAEPGLRQLSAYVVSPQGDRLIVTAPTRPPLATTLRDSLDAGRSVADVVAMAAAWRRAGRLGVYDVAEGGLAALGAEWRRRGRAADAVALDRLATALFPASHAAAARLGDAQRAAGDTAAALAAYRRALELNPRATDADRGAAEAVERKVRGQP